jgi:hypothetical protein
MCQKILRGGQAGRFAGRAALKLPMMTLTNDLAWFDGQIAALNR